MSKVKKIDLGMTAYDELFMTDEERKENRLPKIYDVPLSEIDDFPEHPYRVLDDEDLKELEESIRDRGVITPALIRRKENGRYEMISGHRRKRACEKLGLLSMRCEVVDTSRDEAIILMVDSNSQRSEIAPCDKGKAYKMRLDAMNRQGKQIARFIRLTYLTPELQQFVDEGKIKINPAVELSYLDEEAQQDVVDQIHETESFPSHSQTIRMHKAFEEGKLDYNAISIIMRDPESSQRKKLSIPAERLEGLIPKNCSHEQQEDYVFKALEWYQKYLRKQRENAR